MVIVKTKHARLVYPNIRIDNNSVKMLPHMSSKLQKYKERKNDLVDTGLLIFWVWNYLFLKNYITSERAVAHNVLYYQQLSLACYQVSFYANN